MAHISPFNGIRFNPHLVPDLSAVVAPPYDVLSGAEVAELQARSLYNVTYLTRPAAYSAAAEQWKSWQAADVLMRDEPAMYLYRQTFSDPESGRILPPRTGLMCALDLEQYDSGGVLPHENTIAAHRADRLELMRATHANFESIYGLFSDESGRARRLLNDAAAGSAVVSEVTDGLGSGHSLQRIDNPDLLAELKSCLAQEAILIADGHHRYETALAYHREMPDQPGGGAILITLTAFEDEGLIVLPTHRLLRGVSSAQIEALPERMRKIGFLLTDIAEATGDLATELLGFDMLLSDGRVYRVVLNGGADAAAEAVSGAESRAWKTLDVTVLHKLVLENLLSVSMQSLSSTDQLRYVRDAAEARRLVTSGEFQAAFLLSRPRIPGIRAVSAAGERMPQKSTYFYPKLLSGLVTRSLT